MGTDRSRRQLTCVRFVKSNPLLCVFAALLGLSALVSQSTPTVVLDVAKKVFQKVAAVEFTEKISKEIVLLDYSSSNISTAVAAMSLSYWNLPIRIFAPDASTGSNTRCSDVPHRHVSLKQSIRSAAFRTVISDQCKPTLDHLDAGVCVRMDTKDLFGYKTEWLRIACLPSLIILGFQKCATAELQTWLSVHPIMQRWQGDIAHPSGAGEADFFKRFGSSRGSVAQYWKSEYALKGLLLTKPSDVARIYTFEKSPK